MREETFSSTFAADVEETMKRILGDSAAKAMLFYLGEPDPNTFETRIKSILGDGAEIIIRELKARMARETQSAKHHWRGISAWSAPRPGEEGRRHAGGLAPVVDLVGRAEPA